MTCFLEAHPEFSHIGSYREGQFQIAHDWRRQTGIYVWGHVTDDRFVPKRIGLACSASGIGGRHNLHNRWLAGLFKPDDQREQAVRKYTLEGLGPSAEVYGLALPTRESARIIEKKLRLEFDRYLDIDLSVSSSRIKARMNAWRWQGA